MTRVVALIDGEHYPPVVRAAIASLAEEREVAAAVFLGGREKIGAGGVADEYGVPLVTGETAADALAEALAAHRPDVVVDLSDEPVLSAEDRFRLAGIALTAGATYEGADFRFAPPRVAYTPRTPSIAVIGTGKRVGKTAVCAHLARQLRMAGRDPVVLAMGRGGPPEPELVPGDEVALTTADLLAFARLGRHAASDSYEDAVMSRVATVGCRRCGGGLAGETGFDNVAEGARIADGLGKQLMLLEGSGSAIPPVHADATLLVVGAGRGLGYVRDYFGPYRLARADLVAIAGAEEPIASAADVAEMRAVIARERPGAAIVAVTFRPSPIERVEGKRVFFATTAPPELLGRLSEHLASAHGCEVVAASPYLSDRARLSADLQAAAGSFDVLLTELKAAAIDVVAEEGSRLGVPTVLCDNVPRADDGSDLAAHLERLAELALECGNAR